ncbi:MAG TPA: hypothetical protein VN653_11940, partial [Anaerolineales bacterium]|nr:hypothetical protein [Anaerolineales bacterium]
KTLMQANQFLEAGNYRSLNSDETQKIFVESHIQDSSFSYPNQLVGFLARSAFFLTDNEVDVLYKRAEDGPPPSWPRVLAAFIRLAFDRWSISMTTMVWIWVWLFAWWLITPSLRWPFSDRDSAFMAISMYVGGTLAVPLLVGLFIDTKDNEYWKQQNGVDSFLLRLYTYQGAGIGFNLGYFFIFPFSLARYYLHLQSAVWVEIVAVTLGLVLSNMAARVVPYNLWRAYGRLTLADGGIFFVVALLGPMWGFFFLEYYTILLTPVLGALVILLAITIVVIIATRHSKIKPDKK